MFSNSKEDKWLRIFDITETKLVDNGYTLYKITSTVLNRNFPESTTYLEVWRRYSQIRKLHKEMSILHNHLKLPGSIPPLPQPSIRHRFHPEVIKKRRICAMNLLQHCAKYPGLFSSELFTNFFYENDVSILAQKGIWKEDAEIKCKSLQKDKVKQESRMVKPEISSNSDSSSFKSAKEEIFAEPFLPKTKVQIEPCKDTNVIDNSNSNNVYICKSSGIVTVCHGSNPVKDKCPKSEATNKPGDMLTCVEKCVNDETHSRTQNRRDSNVVDNPEIIVSDIKHGSPEGSTIKNFKEKTRLQAKARNIDMLSLDTVDRHRMDFKERKRSETLSPITPLTNTVYPTPSRGSIEVEQAQYIFTAAQQITVAQSHEKENNLSQALEYYKDGVETLLKGVQGDTVGWRRTAVRRKTAHYLLRAEQLLSKLTKRDEKLGKESNITTSGNESYESSMKCSIEYLPNYKVCGINGNVMIAEDQITGETVAIKVLIKSGGGSGLKTILPRNVPFMVPIIRYHENENTIYLVIKYVSGGKLFEHIRKYFQEKPSVIKLPKVDDPSNAYVGERLLSNSSDSDKKPRAIPSPKVFSKQLDITKECTADSRSQTRSLNNIEFLKFSSILSRQCDNGTQSLISNGYNKNDESLKHLRLNYPSSLVDISHFNSETSSKYVHYESPVFVCSKGEVYSKPMRSCSLDDISKRNKDIENIFVGLNIDEDNKSVGSDTLSGVSDDFSCSVSLNIPVEDLQSPCNTDLDEVIKATISLDDESYLSLKMSESKGFVSGAKDIGGQCSNKEFGTRSPTDCTDHTTISCPILTDRPQNTRENSKSVDIDHLINNSKKLLRDVTQTIENSKKQWIPFNPNAPKKEEVDESEEILSELLAPSAIDKLYKDAYSSVIPDICNNVVEGEALSTKVSETNDTSLDVLSPSTHTSPSKSPFHCCNLSLSNVLERQFSKGNQKPHLPEGLVKVWLSQIISALESLHRQNIIWGDFCPCNVLHDDGGAIILTFVSQWDCVIHNRSSIADQFGYIAPELSDPAEAPVESSDWWSVGALMFHLLVGQDISSAHPCGITSHTEITFPSHISPEAQSLLLKLLCVHPLERIGQGIESIQEIKDHPFFDGLHWVGD